ncbi:MAG: hypothetical protein IKV59_01475 [Lachnospiraceae bacterium]|nr:hypothetical protein [Lachnospiraceae bacterium]
MSYLFDLEQQQKLVLYTERNRIMEVRLPLRKGGEYIFREGYLSDLSAAWYKGQIRMVWHSLEHNIILSGTEPDGDRVILSDAMNIRQYGGLVLFVREERLYLFYSALDPVSQNWQAYVQCLEEIQTEAERIPGTWNRRPRIQVYLLNGQCLLDVGIHGMHQIHIWDEQFSLYEEQITEPVKKLLQEKEAQLQYVSRQYEELRKIAIELQEDGKKMREYIQNRQNGHRSKNDVHKVN